MRTLRSLNLPALAARRAPSALLYNAWKSSERLQNSISRRKRYVDGMGLIQNGMALSDRISQAGTTSTQAPNSSGARFSSAKKAVGSGVVQIRTIDPELAVSDTPLRHPEAYYHD